MLSIVYVSAAIAVISMTVTKSVLFKELRDYLGWRVLKCSYCFSHWVAFAFTIFMVQSITDYLLIDFIITSFALVCFASLFSIGVDIFMERLDND